MVEPIARIILTNVAEKLKVTDGYGVWPCVLFHKGEKRKERTCLEIT